MTGRALARFPKADPRDVTAPGLPGARLALRDPVSRAQGETVGRLAFGTSSGHVFATHSHGEQWELRAEFLPRVLCVRCVGAS